MKMLRFAFAFLLGCAIATPALACSALTGTTTYDSKRVLTADPFFGGTWGNAANGSAFIQRTLSKSAQIYGFYLRYGGTDMNSVGSRILVRAKLKSTATLFTILDLRDAVVERNFSSGTPTNIGPVTVMFPVKEVTALRVDMTGNGWFDLADMLFPTVGCN
jgi:hypothetical protein